MNREDFKILDNDIIYFDNAATSLKPKSVIKEINNYYENLSSNCNRGDYFLASKTTDLFEKTRINIKEFINASKKEEIVFTNNTTDSINKIVFGYYKYILKENDEVLLTKTEHASNILPWYELKKQININIKFIELNKDNKVDINNIKKIINKKTKVISIAHITNTIGDVRPIKEISKLAHLNNIEVLLDGAQSVSHIKTDVKDLDIDFLTFSAHKMCGPTGVGVIYGKYELLKKVKPIILGGGMNVSFESNFNYKLKEIPYKLESGTNNIAGVIGFNQSIQYLKDIGMNNIKDYEIELKNYAISKMKKIKNIEIYNENTESGIILFNIKNIFSQDLSMYLDKYNIYIRSGNHCAKLLKDVIKKNNTCRLSFYFYNTKKEIDKLIEKLSEKNILEKSLEF